MCEDVKVLRISKDIYVKLAVYEYVGRKRFVFLLHLDL